MTDEYAGLTVTQWLVVAVLAAMTAAGGGSVGYLVGAIGGAYILVSAGKAVYVGVSKQVRDERKPTQPTD